VKEIKRTTVTAALPYANGPLHIGHIAGAYLPSDIYVRCLRSQGKEVLFVCGSDEHGAAITIRALKEGTTPRDIVDKYHAMMGKAFQDFGIHFDIYHRTSAELHKQTSQDFFLQLHNNGAFTEQEEQQYYDEEAKQFLADRYIKGTCPVCGNTEAYGDQCEKCGTALSPKELKDVRSTLSGSAPVLMPTKHWYLQMQHEQAWMEDWINKGELDFKPHHDVSEWKPQVLGQCNSWLKEGLRPRAMTRDLDWGVPVPPSLEGSEGKVLYVWLDAPIGYITATKQWAKDKGVEWEKWWKSDETRLLHFIGKDNIVFHCIIFPILLKMHGGFILPQNVPANEFLNLEGQKLSTSRNWAVWLHEYIERWPGRQDELRYALASILPEFKDSEFTWKDFQDKNNNELVAILGGFVQRVLVLCHKYCDGKVPEVPDAVTDEDALEIVRSITVTVDLRDTGEWVSHFVDKFRFRDALARVMDVARAGNAYLTKTEPWKLTEADSFRMRFILSNCLHVMGALSVWLEPFLPYTAQKLRTMLGLGDLRWDDAMRADLLKPGTSLGKPEHLFKRIADEEIEVERVLLAERRAANVDETIGSILAPEKTIAATGPDSSSMTKPNINFDQFSALDLRIGTIIAAERVPKADKLLKLTIGTGEAEPRTVVSGIAMQWEPDDLIGKQVLVLCNLEPRKLKGIESQGMVLMAEDADGKLRFVQPSQYVPPGSEVR
jgi:methionyl-tRNA synthetase